MKQMIQIARDYTPTPLGRSEIHGPFNGARFRDEHIIPALREHDTVTIDLTGIRGKAPSFLDEAFGTLIEHGFSAQELQRRLNIIADDDDGVVREVWGYVEDHARKAEVAH